MSLLTIGMFRAAFSLRLLAGLLPVLALSACVGAGPAGDDKEIPLEEDLDGDGHVGDDDCDESNPAVHAGAEERCDDAEVDEDCNGTADNADPGVVGGILVYHDADGDSFGDDATAAYACETTTGYTTLGGDCDDTNPRVSPDGSEACDAADADEDCNGAADNNDPNASLGDQIEAWIDRDGDGYGAIGQPELFCDVPEGYVLDATDCEDDDANMNPAGTEMCNGADDDCDGYRDENNALDVVVWYADDDGDGYGDMVDTRMACDAPPSFVDDATDCDDQSLDIHPGATEYCDGEDDNCDGVTDEDAAVNVRTWYLDTDADGYGDAASTTLNCDLPAGYVADDTDCNDRTAAIHPDMPEVCDGGDVDENCNGLADDDDSGVQSTGKTTFYADTDADTFGNEDRTVSACDLPSGYVADDTDCNDASATINPAAAEICDSASVDEDCDGTTDDNDTSTESSGKTTWYRDSDRDSYGDSTLSVVQCDLPSGYVALSTDCDDTTSTRSPANTEVCDASNKDEDCDGLSDDDDDTVRASTLTTWYADTDGDGYGTSTSSLARCERPTSYVASSTDCDDASGAVSPAATEVCFDGLDENCDASELCGRDLEDADRAFIGETAGDYAGYDVSSAGDMNGDGIDDLAIGAYATDGGGSSAGSVYVVYGGGTGQLDLSAANRIFTGEDASDYAGITVAGLGDVTGDGYDDLAIGATGDDSGGTSAGKVYFITGSGTGNLDLSAAYANFVGESTSDGAGAALAGAGDVSGDGKPDILIGSPSRSSSAGRVYLLTSVAAGTTDLSVASAILSGESSTDYAGRTVDNAGDVNGDGYDDILTGAYGDDDGGSSAGAAYIVLGPQTGSSSLSAADAKLYGASSSDYLGYTVAGAGDVNDDGYDDILAGAYGYGTYGTVYVVYGPIASDASISSAADFRIDGTSSAIGKVMSGGDLDGDGHSDIVIGNEADSTAASTAGAAWLFLGPLSGTSTTTAYADARITGVSSTTYFGISTEFVGAQDGSGAMDLLIGAYGESTGGADAGAAYLFSASGL